MNEDCLLVSYGNECERLAAVYIWLQPSIRSCNETNIDVIRKYAVCSHHIRLLDNEEILRSSSKN